MGIGSSVLTGFLAGGPLSLQLVEDPNMPGVWGSGLLVLVLLLLALAFVEVLDMEDGAAWAGLVGALIVMTLFATSLLIAMAIAMGLGAGGWAVARSVERWALQRQAREQARECRWREAAALEEEAGAHVARVPELGKLAEARRLQLADLSAQLHRVRKCQGSGAGGDVRSPLAQTARVLMEAAEHVRADIDRLDREAVWHVRQQVALRAAASAARALRWKAPTSPDIAAEPDLAHLEAEAEIASFLGRSAGEP